MTLPTDDGDFDAERVEVGPRVYGGPVDGPGEHPTIYATVTASADAAQRPIVPGWMRNRDQRREVARAAARVAVRHAGYHATHSPQYAWRVLRWAPVGVFTTIWRLVRWTWDLEAWSTRQDAASRNRVDEYLALSRQRDRRVAARLWVFIPTMVAVAVAVALLVTVAPAWVWGAVAVVVLPAAAWIGRPPDKPITDRVTVGERFTRLTAEQVRGALCRIGIARIKDPGDLRFPTEIHRDGPGWLAIVDLPEGVEAIDVIERRGRLSSALRLPVDQVWPGAGDEHSGSLHLWVAAMPVSKMAAPRWALASPSARTSVFDGYPIGHDERLRPVAFTPFQRNVLIGGQPGSGKTYAGRAIVLGALLDPSCEVWLAAFKAAEDFYDVSAWCTRYVCGLDDVTMATAAAMVADGLAEVQRRQATLGRLKRAGKIIEGRTSTELAAAGLGLHPLALVFDEAHEILGDKQVAADMVRLIKQGRSVGVWVVLLTQVASKDSVPTEITKCVSSRWCLSVLDQVANDQVMGTGAYKRGLSGTAYRPEIDAGWGVTTGIAGGYTGPVRAYYPSPADLAVLLARIATVRSGAVFAPVDEATARRDVLADVIVVFAHAGRRGLHWTVLAELLAAELPDAYTGLSPDVLSATLRATGVPSVDVKDQYGTNLKGCRQRDVADAIQRREVAAPGRAEITDAG